MTEQLRVCPHCNESSIREAKVTTAAPGWEAHPPSLESFRMARVCYLCFCQWTLGGEFVRKGDSCIGKP
jgi:hypothetical protein